MTLEPSDLRFSREPALQHLHDELRAPPEGDPTQEQDPADALDDLAAALSSALDTGMFAPEVQAYVDSLLRAGESPSPELRKRLTQAADRGLNYRRRDSQPLPLLLAARRKEEDLAVSDLAESLGVPEQEIHRWEAGTVEVRTLSAQQLVAWAGTLDLPSTATVTSLRRALELTAPVSAKNAAGHGGRPQLSPSDEELLADVQHLLAV